MKSYHWRRTGVLIVLVAGCILLVFILVGPWVYLYRHIHIWFIAHRRLKETSGAGWGR